MKLKGHFQTASDIQAVLESIEENYFRGTFEA
jgi:hypothetical protein